MAQPLLDRNGDERLKFHNLTLTYLASDKNQGIDANNLDECNRLFEVQIEDDKSPDDVDVSNCRD
jgi:hypothetical protein